MADPGFTPYQLRELKKLDAEGFKFERVKRMQDDLNPWASVYVRNEHGRSLVALPVSRAEENYMRAGH